MPSSTLAILQHYLLLLIPIVIIELVLMVIALIDLVKQPRTRGPKWAWVLIIVFINLIGPILYFILGRKDE